MTPSAPPPQPGEDRWTFKQDLQAPLWTRPWTARRGSAAGPDADPGSAPRVDLSPGVRLEAGFPDPQGRLDTAHDDLRRFLAAAGVEVEGGAAGRGDARSAGPGREGYVIATVAAPDLGPEAFRLSVAPDRFAAHLDAMQEAGYTTVSLYDLLAHLTNGVPLPEKPVIITFDDGYRDNYENAFPLLAQRGMTASFFVVTDFIDEERPGYLTWEMVREMYAVGMSIESHGRNHVSLANKNDDYLVWQALGSLETIEYELGVRPRFVSYPAGDYDQRTLDIFASANYWAGFTTQQGATHSSDDDLFQLRRVRVRYTTTPEELLRLLALDW